MKSILLIFVILSTCAFARQNPEFMEFGLAREDNRLKGKKTNFHVKIGGAYVNYDNGHAFNGAIDPIKKQNEGLAGLDLTLGYQIMLYGPLSITINSSWYHFSKNKEDIDNAENEAVDTVVSQIERDYKVYGGGFSAALNYEFQANNLVWQPFVEFGGGVGKATFSIDYLRELPTEEESYNATFRDTYSFINTSIGLNIIAASGIFAYMKAGVMQFVGIKRSFKGTERINTGDTTDSIERDSETPKNFANASYTLGMGYTF